MINEKTVGISAGITVTILAIAALLSGNGLAENSNFAIPVFAISAAYASQEGASDNGEPTPTPTPEVEEDEEELVPTPTPTPTPEVEEPSTPDVQSERSLATVIIVKAGNLGPQDKGDFEAEVTGNQPSPTSVNLGGDESTRTVTIRPGSYNVHEVGESGGTLEDRPDFDVSYSDDCSGTIMPRTTVTCTITNDFTGTP